MPVEPVSARELTGALAACNSGPEQRDAALLWLGWTLAAPLGDVLALQVEHLQADGVFLPVRQQLVPALSAVVELVGRVLRHGIAAAELRGGQPGRPGSASPLRLRERRARTVVSELLGDRGGSGATWQALREGGLLQTHRIGGWRPAAALAEAVGLDLAVLLARSLQQEGASALAATPFTTFHELRLSVAPDLYEGPQ